MAQISKSEKLPAIYMLDPYHPDAIQKLKEAPNVRLILPNDPSKSNFHQDASILLLRSETRITKSEIMQCKRLQCIIKQGVGVDNIDLQACHEAKIQVYNTPGLNSESVAELSIAMALYIARRIGEIDHLIRKGDYVIRSNYLGKSLYGKTIGIIGMGGIGFELAKKWVGAMEGKVLGYDPYCSTVEKWKDQLSDRFTRCSSLEKILESSDVISLHLPLTENTKNLISHEQFSIMKSDAILLNCARGGIVDEEALKCVLEKGKLFGVGLDALSIEPPTKKDHSDLLKFPNVLLTPHIGASTKENQSKSGLKAVEMALQFLSGELTSKPL
ncbi:hypothetical protein L7F22_067939 [Adiantum nelumboides]|nr:hypothetical protein [Adiantum nelumboides]